VNNPSTNGSPAATSGNGVAPATEAAPASNFESDFAARSAALFGTEASPQAPDENVDGSTPASPTADASTVASEDDAAAAARRERLAALSAREAGSVDAKNRAKAEAELRQRLASAEKRAEEAERMAGQRIDITNLTEAQFFEHAARAKVTPQRLGEWLREQTQNPELAASRAVESALQPKLTEIEKRLAEKEARLDAFLSEQASAKADMEEAQAFQGFASFTASNAVTSPRAAAFMREFGPEEYRKVATSVAASLPPNAGPQALLDSLEENFAKLARVYAPSGAPAKPSIPQPNPGAAKPMTTVSNTLAQTRASVVDEDTEWASLPFEERSSRLFR
jgi:hypothetical protein